MIDYVLTGKYAQERMDELRNGRRRVEPFVRIGRANRQGLFAMLLSWWAPRDGAKSGNRLEKAR